MTLIEYSNTTIGVDILEVHIHIYYIDDEQRYYMRSGHTCRRSHLTHKNQR